MEEKRLAIKLYEVNPKYIDYLVPFAPHLFHNKKPGQSNERKYIGVILVVEGMNYFAPLSSYKPKHDKMKNSLDFIKIGNYAVVNINNMFPVPKGEYTYVNIKAVENALELYKHKIKNGNSTNLAKRCNDFCLLEEKCRQYDILT